MNRKLYILIITVTSLLWALGLTYFGVSFGRNYTDGTFGWCSLGLITLAVIVTYIFYKYIQSLSLDK